MTSSAGAGRGVVVGAGAQGRVVLDVWREQHPDRSFVFVDDDPSLWGSSVLGVPVEGGLNRLTLEGQEAVVALGNNLVRQTLAQRLATQVSWARVIHPSAMVSAVINTEARVGSHVVVNSGAIIEHDCVLEDFSSISPGVRMGGRVVVGVAAFLSTGVTVAPRIRIGAGTVVGAGAVVTSDLPEHVLALGVPARVVRAIGPDFNWGRLL
jgi:sugar O-acyltransferase (sialic acid O-acetyltransferase NeuD family)